MARRVLPLLLVAACCLLFHASAVCATRPSPGRAAAEQQPLEPAAVHGDDAVRHPHLVLETEAAHLGGTARPVQVADAAAAGAPQESVAAFAVVAPPPARAEEEDGDGVSSGPGCGGGRALVRVRAGLWRPAPLLLLRSKLPRRLLLAGAEPGAAAVRYGSDPSCQSYNARTKCPPASKP